MTDRAEQQDQLAAGKPLFFNSIPKCGKNLVVTFLAKLGYQRLWFADDRFNRAAYARCFDAFPGRASYVYPWDPEPTGNGNEFEPFRADLESLGDNQFYHQHTVFEGELARIVDRTGVRSLFVYRDPRDALVSALNYARTQALPNHVAEMIEGYSPEDALLFLIEGDDRFVPFTDYFQSFHGWRDNPGTLCLRFEDMIGPKGGGSLKRQKTAFAALAAHLDWAGPQETLDRATDAAFNPRAGTFFRGQTGTWREYFTPRVERAFLRRHETLLRDWGYDSPGVAPSFPG
jgi:hypothetical protein